MLGASDVTQERKRELFAKRDHKPAGVDVLHSSALQQHSHGQVKITMRECEK